MHEQTKDEVNNGAAEAAGAAASEPVIPLSFTQQILALKIGEAAYRGFLIDPLRTLAQVRASGPEDRDKFRKAITASVSGAKRKSPDAVYSVGVVNVLDHSGRLHTLATVIRES